MNTNNKLRFSIFHGIALYHYTFLFSVRIKRVLISVVLHKYKISICSAASMSHVYSQVQFRNLYILLICIYK